MSDSPPYEGILLIDKPTGFTSHDVVARLRRIFQMKRIGHAGTLDPMATGLLICLLGKATKASQYLISMDKEYEGAITLGVETNSQDADGEVVATKPVPELSADDLTAALKGFLGDQYQIPPMHSAIKVGGVPLYKMARKGQSIEREPRFVRISTFRLQSWEPPVLQVLVRCSKGTYIRTLAHDLGQRLGCGAHLSALRRTASGDFRITGATTLEALAELSPQGRRAVLLPVADVLPSTALGG